MPNPREIITRFYTAFAARDHATMARCYNVIDAAFTFRDGLIVRHVDRFDLYAWARQALGTRGVLLGWAPPVQAAIRRTAAQALAKAMR
jgi:hypothetical protein